MKTAIFKAEKFSFLIESNGIRYGTGSPPPILEPSKETLPFVRATDIKEGEIKTQNLLHISKEQPAKLDKCKLSAGEIIIVRSGVNTGDCAVVPFELAGAYAAYDLIIRLNKKKILSKFATEFLDTKLGRVQINLLKARAAQPHINADEFGSIEIPLPPLPIQEKLVEEMERARESRRRKLAESESIISQANKEFQNQLGISLATNTTKRKTFALKLNQLQGKRLDVNFHNPSNDKVQSSLYENRPLKSLVTLLSGGTPSKSEAEFWDGNIPWVSPKDFKEFYLNDAEDHISEKGVKDAKLKLIPKHSVLIVVRSGVLIHSLPVAFNLEPVTINQDLKALITNDDINAEYLAFYLRVLGKRLLPSITKHSTTVQSVNTGEFEALQIPVPPLSIQQKLVDELKDVLETSRRLKSEAESEWQAAKDRFEARLLGK